MNKKFLLMVFTSVFLLLAMVGAQFIMPASADPVIIRVPEDYPTIQKAINAASPGDTIQVASETYYENVTINKSLTLIGENRSTTIIDGNWTGYAVIYVTADNVDISGFAIQKGYNGIWLTSSSGNTISGNTISGHENGIYMEGESGNNTISGNTIENNHNGIVVLGFGTWIIGGSALNVYDNIQRGSHEIPPPIPSNHTIAGNTIFDNFNGILLYSRSSGNTVKGNTIKGNLYGIYIDTGPNSSNILYHNNFIDNPIQVGRDRLTPAFLNTWDNGAEGNYWSDYNGTDMNGDGIGDTPHVIDEKDGDGYPLIEKDQDNYPLMAPWSDFRVFNIPLEEKVYQAAMFSNSTIASFNFSHLNKQISFNVTGPSGTSGFCNVTIPKTLLRANETNPWQVLLDGNPINYTKVENATHTSLYFTYTHSTHHVQIIGTWVTPEFPTALILPLLIITAILATILGKITRSTKKPHNYANSKRSD